ncbi:MAG: hypothetical protein AB7T07_07570 [Steroidobacteraceae bacterium]
MEIFLLLLDELDDAAASLRMLWRQLLGFLLACGLFAMSILTAMRWPLLAVAVILLLALLPVLRRKPIYRYRMDP